MISHHVITVCLCVLVKERRQKQDRVRNTSNNKDVRVLQQNFRLVQEPVLEGRDGAYISRAPVFGENDIC